MLGADDAACSSSYVVRNLKPVSVATKPNCFFHAPNATLYGRPAGLLEPDASIAAPRPTRSDSPTVSDSYSFPPLACGGQSLPAAFASLICASVISREKSNSVTIVAGSIKVGHSPEDVDCDRIGFESFGATAERVSSTT